MTNRPEYVESIEQTVGTDERPIYAPRIDARRETSAHSALDP